MTPGLYLATRAHHELTAVLAYLCVHLRRYKKGQLAEQEFVVTLERLQLARRYGLDKVYAASRISSAAPRPSAL